ncbi:MAG: diguanylate cyclase [Methylobacter sp.]|nr:MAG: diguanylate cyclase [Methylobacter sp.]
MIDLRKQPTLPESYLRAEKLHQAFSVAYASMAASFLLASVLAYIQYDVISHALVLSWWASIFAVTLIRVNLVRNYLQLAKQQTPSNDVWLFRFRLGVVAISILWGSTGFLMFPEQNLPHQLFLIFIIAGLSSAALVSYAADVHSAQIFCSSLLLPLALQLQMQGNSLYAAMSVASVLYLSYIMIWLRHSNKIITENIVLRWQAHASEEAIRVSEERYRLLLNHSPVGIFHFDKELSITYCNEHVAEILHKPTEDITGTKLPSWADAAIIPTLISTLTGRTASYEGPYSNSPDSVNRWIDMSCAPSLNVQGEIIGGIAVIRDSSERKQVEEMLRIGAVAFESQTGIMVTDADSKILRVNQAFTKMTGYSAEEIVGKTPAILGSGRHGQAFFHTMWDDLRSAGFWQGEIWNQHKNGLVSAEWLTISAVTAPGGKITHYVGAYSDITQNKDAIAEIHRLAYYDPLTGLPNRRLLQDRLSQALAASARTGIQAAIMFLDLDNFKTLNDTRGHEAGDRLLVEVAKRLRNIVRETDMIGRLGGDEFVVLLENLGPTAEQAAQTAQQIGDKILSTLSLPYRLDDHEFMCSTSIGIRLFRERETVEELLKHADLAMYQAKSAGRNTLCFFDPAMQTLVTERAALEKDLRRALQNNEFELFYQPQVDSNRVIGAEALLRWKHPQRGWILPLQFIPLAEKTKLILPIGLWVLDQACLQLCYWKANPLTEDLQLAINVSAYQFQHPDFVAQVKNAVERYRINPLQLKLELTESVMLDNIRHTVKKMQSIRDLGVQFSLDDFGTGYSSLAYLTQLPLDQLKIDRSFVSKLGLKNTDAVIVQTIIGMAQNLALPVIAEGVESQAQWDFLVTQGCPLFQGYLFGKPLPISAFEATLQAPSQAGGKLFPGT